MMDKLFDESTGLLLLDEMVYAMPSYQKIIEDSIITEDEIVKQSEVVLDLLRQIDRDLQEKDRQLVLKAICEIAVLYELSANQ